MFKWRGLSPLPILSTSPNMYGSCVNLCQCTLMAWSLSVSFVLQDWLCKTLLALRMYAQMASINWMFVEGLFLHSRLTSNVFHSRAPFPLYYTIGWGVYGAGKQRNNPAFLAWQSNQPPLQTDLLSSLATLTGAPLVFIVGWATTMALHHPAHCWRGYSTLSYVWILVAPMVAALMVGHGSFLLI